MQGNLLASSRWRRCFVCVVDAIPDTAQVAASELSIVEGLMNKMKAFFKNPPNGVLASEPEQRVPSGRRMTGGSSASPLNRRSIFTFLALLAALAVGLLFLLPGGPLQAQDGNILVQYNETGTEPVVTLTAEDPEEVDPPMVWSLLEAPGGITVGGTALTTDDVADFGDFEIDPQTGVLDFAMKPNYEIPTDAGLNNEYKVVVQASDGGRTNHLNWFKVTVRVQDIEETGKVTWTVDPDGTNGVLATPNLLQFQPGAVLTASVTDPDGDAGATAPSGTAISDFSIETVSWKWYRSSSKSSMGTDEISGAITNTYTVKDTSTDNDVGMFLWAVASYTDRRWSGKEAKFVSPHPVQAARADNAVPEFIETNFERTVAENTDKDINIGARARATDDDGDVLTYSLDVSGVPDCTSDDDACFGIDAATGQVMTRAELDYETKTSYTVMVKATDSSGGEGTATIAITVSNVNEEPDFGATRQR